MQPSIACSNSRKNSDPMSINQIARLKRIAALAIAQVRHQPGSVWVRLLRDQARACDCCGRLLSTGDEVTLPRGKPLRGSGGSATQ
jgi:hypothetical protein